MGEKDALAELRHAKEKEREAEEKVRLLKKKIDEDQARIIEAEAKQKSAQDLFEGEKDALALQLSTAEGKVKGLQALQGADAAGWEKETNLERGLQLEKDALAELR